MTDRTHRCDKCGGNPDTVNEYEFYYGSVRSYSSGRLPFDSTDAHLPGRTISQVHGSRRGWICDGCILRKRIFLLMLAIGLAVVNSAVGYLVYCYWRPIASTLKRLASTSPSCCIAVPLMVLGAVTLFIVGYSPLVALVYAFEKKDEIGASLAINVYRNTPEHKKRISDLEKYNKEVEAVNRETGLIMNPTEGVAFWTPKQRVKDKEARKSR